MSIPNDVFLFVSAKWRTPFEQSVWEAFRAAVGADAGETRLVLWPAFENPEDPLAGRIAGLRALHDPEKHSVQWQVTATPAPRLYASDPKSLTEAQDRISKRLGGLAGLRRLMEDHFPRTTTVAAEYLLEMRLWQADGWFSTILHQQAATQFPQLSDLGQDGRVEQFGMRLQNGTNGLEEFSVVFAHAKPHYHADIQGRALLEWNEDFRFPQAERLTEFVLLRTFERREKQDANPEKTQP
jgi:hypothetical protein